MKVRELVKLLLEKDQEKEVFIVTGITFSSIRSVGEFTDGDITLSDTKPIDLPEFK